MQFHDVLLQLGMNRKQAAIYLSLLQLGQATVFAIAEKSGVKRPTVYVVLEELLRKEIVVRVPHARKQMYRAKAPDQLLQERALALEAVRGFLPRLLALTATEEKPSVLYYEGMAGARQAFAYRLDDLRGEEIVGFFAHAAHESAELTELFTWYSNRLKERGANLRGIAPAHENLRGYRERDTVYGHIIKQVPLDRYDATVSIEITSAFVRIFSFQHLQTIIIDNPMIATSLRQVFSMLWDRVPEIPSRPKRRKRTRSKTTEKH